MYYMALQWSSLAFLSLFPFSFNEGVCANDKGLLQVVEAKYKKAGTLISKTRQSLHNRTTGKTTESPGVLRVSFPGKFNWKSEGPSPSELVSNGKTLWLYTPPFDEGEKGQVIIEDVTKKGKITLVHRILRAEFSKLKPVKSIASPLPGLRAFEYKSSTKGSQGIAKVHFVVDSRNLLLSQVTLFATNGNQTVIDFNEVVLGSKISPEQFVFSIPKDTDVVGLK